MNNIYDSGSNISIINSKLIRIKEKHESKVNKSNLITINGVKKTNGLTTIKIKIFDIEEKANVYIVDGEDFKYDFLIGLDIIKQFKLVQDKDLKISQKRDETEIKENINEEKILMNVYTDETNNSKENNKRYPVLVNFNEQIAGKERKINLSNLNTKQKTEIHNLIDSYSSIFARDKYDIGTVKEYEARIDILVDRYCSKRPYRCSIEDKKEIEEQVAKLPDKNLIEESYSPFAAPVSLAFKKEDNKRSRLCIDFRDLNKIVVPQAQPFPSMTW